MTFTVQHTSHRSNKTPWKMAFVLVAISLPLFVGCNKAQDSTVSGRVTMDGKTLDRGTVTFTNAKGPVSSPATGQIQSDGSYQVQIGQSGEMVAGEYSVGISSRTSAVPSPDGGPPAPGKLLTPARYASSSTSGLRYQVRAGKNVIDIALAGETLTTNEAEESTVLNEMEPAESATAETVEEEEPTSEFDSVMEAETTDAVEIETKLPNKEE